MLGAFGLLIVAVCFISQSSARLSVTVLSRDYSYVRPDEVLVTHIQRVLDSLGALPVTVHPRMRHLYELLRKDARGAPRPGARHHVLDFNKTLRPAYDVNKLNRIYTTEADG